MRKQIIFPKLSSKTSEGILISWNKNVGEIIQSGEVLYEVETDKVVHEIESPFAGSLSKLLVSEGDEVSVGRILAEIEIIE